MQVFENKNKKYVVSKTYNSAFNKQTGFFARWGATKGINPDLCPYGPEILDMEISTGACSGGGQGEGCKYCYKNNGSKDVVTKNMSYETFKQIFALVNENHVLTQIAFGITDINTNPDFFKIMNFSKQHGVIPNYTTSGFQVTKEVAEETAKVCGAVSVSIHNKEVAFDAIKMYLDAGMTQVNVHWVMHSQNVQETLDIIKSLKTDERTKGINALVLLAYKPKGRNNNLFHPITDVDAYKKIISCAKEYNMNLGYDSCSVPNVLRAYDENISNIVDGCESACFSLYCNVDGTFFPCSFSEGERNWKSGLSYKEVKNLKELWYNERFAEFRIGSINSTKGCTSCVHKATCRRCQIYSLYDCERGVK